MDEQNYIKVTGNIIEVKFDINQCKIFLSLDIKGEKKTVEISAEQLIQFPTDQSTKQSIMLKYYNAWKARQEKGLPVNLQLTEKQLKGESNV
jgi:hypothetical protein